MKLQRVLCTGQDIVKGRICHQRKLIWQSWRRIAICGWCQTEYTEDDLKKLGVTDYERRRCESRY